MAIVTPKADASRSSMSRNRLCDLYEEVSKPVVSFAEYYESAGCKEN